MKENEGIRKMAMQNGVHHWQIAAECGVSEQTFCRWLRFPLSAEKEDMIMKAIEKLSKGAC